MRKLTSPVATSGLAQMWQIKPNRCPHCRASGQGFNVFSDGDPRAACFQCRRCGRVTVRARKWVLARFKAKLADARGVAASG